jgi:hypothetical protein
MRHAFEIGRYKPAGRRAWAWRGLLICFLITPSTRAQSIDFNRDIRPILSDSCFHCHGPDSAKRKAKLRLDTEDGARTVLAPGDAAGSELVHRITASEETERMPPASSGRKLNPSQIALLKRWIDEGAKWEKHWSLLVPRRPDPPPIQNATWPRNPIDHFILTRIEKEGLTPSPEAEKSTLLRRVTLDLTGLPPTLEELDVFLGDSSPYAYEKAVDRLLASPRYGERMVLDWLDASRYADTNGFQGDRTRMNWPWRDWVIDALNRNMPFDQFTIEQLAGDLLPNATVSQKVATGFNRNHMLNGEGGRIPEEARVDYVVDRVDTTATVWLGLTLGCARCHDHKYDPFSQKDYYKLFAYFNNVTENGAVEGNGLSPPWIRLPSPGQDEAIRVLTRQRASETEDRKRIEASLPSSAAFQRMVIDTTLNRYAFGVPDHLLASEAWLRAAQRAAETDRRSAAAEKDVPLVMVMEEQKERRDTHVLLRGVYDKYGEKVEPGVPENIHALPEGIPSNRLALARWLVNPANPLTARVAVNRYWQSFFGTGLVKTAEDFGTQGEWPSHPELLDWLATEFSQNDWDVKHIHRLIVTSATYRQSSRLSPEHRERDPENRLLARGPRYRLPSTIIRDQALAVSGLLVERLGGPPVRPYQPPGIWEEMTFGFIKYDQDKGPNLYRRSLYTFWRRTVGPTTLFDSGARQVCTVRQARTNTPLQALTLLNDVTFVEAARVLAERVTGKKTNVHERLDLLFRLATARPPKETEQHVLERRLRDLRKHYESTPEAARELVIMGDRPPHADVDAVELAAYTGVAMLVLNLDEVLCKE